MSSFRITTSMKLNTYRYNLNQSNNTLYNSSTQVQTHRKFNSYAESPADATHAWIVRRDIMDNTSFQRNNDDTYTRFQTAWLAMGNMKTHLEDATGRTAILRGLNDPTAAAKQELGGVLINTADTIVQSMNGAKYGEEFVFSGTNGSEPPFSWDEKGRLLYRGINLTPPDYHAGWKDYNNPTLFVNKDNEIVDAQGNVYSTDGDKFVHPTNNGTADNTVYIDSTGKRIKLNPANTVPGGYVQDENGYYIDAQGGKFKMKGDYLADDTGNFYVDEYGNKFDIQGGVVVDENGNPYDTDDDGNYVDGNGHVIDEDSRISALNKRIQVDEEGYFVDEGGNGSLIKDSDGKLVKLVQYDNVKKEGDLWGWGNKLNDEGIPENFNAVYPSETLQKFPETAPTAPDANDTTKYPDGEKDPAYQKDLEKYNAQNEEYTAKKEWYEYFQNIKSLNKLAEEVQYADLGMGMEEIKNEDGTTKMVGSTVYNNALPGIKMLGYGIDEDGDPKNLVLLMKEFGELLETCDETGAYPNYGDKEKAFRLLSKYDEASTLTLSGYTYTDVQGKFLQSNGQTLYDQGFNLDAQKLELEEVDMAQAISVFMWDYSCYSAGLKIGTQLLSESLIDYMR